jgi:hypothetical protein
VDVDELKQVYQAEIRKTVAKLIGDLEVPVPEGHARRRRGFSHRFGRAKDVGPFSKRLCTEFGTEPRYVHKGHAVPCLVWRSARPVDGWQVVLWLPDGADFFVVSV